MNVGWINSTMKEVNEETDNLYESLMDGEDIRPACKRLLNLIRYIKNTYEQEGQRIGGSDSPRESGNDQQDADS